MENIYLMIANNTIGLFVVNAVFAVDVFFLIGGFFLSYALLMGSKKKYL